MKNLYYFAILAVLLIAQSCQGIFEEEPVSDPEAIFENLWSTFNEEYAVFEERGVDWQDMYVSFRPEVNASTTDDELFAILAQMLQPLDDGHVTLTAPGKPVFYANKIRRQKIDDLLFNLDVVRNEYLEPGYVQGVDEGEGEGVPYIYGKIKNENVGYIFFDHVGENFFALEDFLNDFADVDGIIIDMRHNDGGDFTYCYSEIGRLVDEERFVFRSKTKNGKGPDDYTAWHDWSIYPSGPYVDKPIVVLIDRYTISAGERAVMALNTLPNVTMIGDTTNGAHATLVGRELANGWYYSLVTQKVELADGQSYEGIGIAPDVLLRNELHEVLQGKDRVLERGVEEVR
jgi:carboxyl-terminal processing protease